MGDTETEDEDRDLKQNNRFIKRERKTERTVERQSLTKKLQIKCLVKQLKTETYSKNK